MKLYNGYEHVEVNLVEYDKNIARRNFLALRQTWTQHMDHPYDTSDPLCVKFIKDLMNHKLFGTFIKTATLMFQFKNISRICLAQLTRDNYLAFNSQSNMPQPLSHEITVPKYVYENPEWRAKLENIQTMIEDLYDELTENGIPFQDSRYVGLHGQQISITGICDVEKFQGFCRSRLNNNTHDELNLVYRLAKRALRKQIEADHASGELDDLSYYMWNKFEKASDSGEASFGGKVTFFDPMFCNSMKRFPNGAAEPKPMFDANKLSWKYELIKMYEECPDLLLQGEKEMISKWKRDDGSYEIDLPNGFIGYSK